MKKWEYMCPRYEATVDVDILNKIGENGWELILIIPTSTSMYRYLFKKPKIEKSKSDKTHQNT